MADPRVEATLANVDTALARLDRITEGVRSYAPRATRAAGDLARRVTRAVGVLGTAGVGAVGYAVAVAPIGIEGLLIGVPVAGAAALGAALLPTRRKLSPAPKFAQLPPARLAPAAREWLQLRSREFPRSAAPAVKRILDRLATLAPVIAALPESDATLVDARRLLSDHLPRLVDAWAAVPPPARAENAEVDTQLVGGLAVISEELERLWATLTQDKLRDLAAEDRFLSSRYRSDGGAV